MAGRRAAQIHLRAVWLPAVVCTSRSTCYGYCLEYAPKTQFFDVVRDCLLRGQRSLGDLNLRQTTLMKGLHTLQALFAIPRLRYGDTFLFNESGNLDFFHHDSRLAVRRISRKDDGAVAAPLHLCVLYLPVCHCSSDFLNLCGNCYRDQCTCGPTCCCHLHAPSLIELQV